MVPGVDLTQYGPIVAVVAAFIWYLDKRDKRDAERGGKMTDALNQLSLNSEKQTDATDRNTVATDKLVVTSHSVAKATEENLQFMKNLNGSLRKAVEDHKK